MPTGADVAGTYSILSLILTLSVTPSLYTLVYVSFSLSFFCALTKWRDASLQTSLTQDHNAASHVIQSATSSLFYFLSMSMSNHQHPYSLFPSVLFPQTKADKGLSFLPSRLALCVFVLYQTRLPLLLYSFLLFAKKVSRGPWLSLVREGLCGE